MEANNILSYRDIIRRNDERAVQSELEHNADCYCETCTDRATYFGIDN